MGETKCVCKKKLPYLMLRHPLSVPRDGNKYPSQDKGSLGFLIQVLLHLQGTEAFISIGSCLILNQSTGLFRLVVIGWVFASPSQRYIAPILVCKVYAGPLNDYHSVPKPD